MVSPAHSLGRLVICFLAVVVGLEAWWILSRNPFAIVSEGQPPVLLQGNRYLEDGEQFGEIVPGARQPPPPHMAFGEGHSSQPAPQSAPASPPPPGAEATAPHSGEEVQTPPPGVDAPPRIDDYHKLLTGILAVDQQHNIAAGQARELLAAVRAREAIRGTDVRDATDVILDTLDARQRAYLNRWRDERKRQGKPSTAPEELPHQITGVLRLLETK